ncbi:hypothetical protein D9757_015159 [Collybiopsis confluens]|uniref:Uncharacterized protein n=1 Tax=Collybiopsis confluens TaxID=2823264 RepID=A0A8H5FSH1_9AGAR|nr:hypothetical protein D9757_015159 [Collybiopsis confluens]
MSHIERFEPKCNGRPLRVNIVSRGPEEDLLVFLSPPAVSHPTLDTRSQSTSKSDYYHSGRRIRNPPASDLETFSFVRPSNPRASILQSSIRLFPLDIPSSTPSIPYNIAPLLSAFPSSGPSWTLHSSRPSSFPVPSVTNTLLQYLLEAKPRAELMLSATFLTSITSVVFNYWLSE